MVRASSRQQKTAEVSPANGHSNGTAEESMEVDVPKQKQTIKSTVTKKSKGKPAKSKATTNGTDQTTDLDSKETTNGSNESSPAKTAVNGGGTDSKSSSPTTVSNSPTTAKSGRGRKRAATDSGHQAQTKKVKVVNSGAVVSSVSLSIPNVVGGVVLAVGMGDIGQLGLGPDVEEKTRVAVVPGLPENIVAVSAGGLHSVCLDSQGKVYTWGCNDEGALGRTTSCDEDNFSAGVVEGIDGVVVQISAGDCHSAALTENGTVYAWGSFRDNNGPLGFLERGNLQRSPRELAAGSGEAVIRIASGNNHLALLTHSGRLVTCGCGESGQLGRLAEMFATRDSRNRNGFDALLLPAPVRVCRKGRRLVQFDAVWAGGDNTFARCGDTALVYGWGLNNYNQMGEADTNTKFQPTLISAFKGQTISQITCGQHHCLALESTGSVHVMGRHDYGRLGLGEDDKKDAISPTKLAALNEDGTHVSAAGSVSLVVTKDGRVLGFGMGTSNQLSQGNEDDCWEPTAFTGKQLQERRVVSASVGGQHTVLLVQPKETS